MFQNLLSQIEGWANKRHAFTALALVAFTESSFFPIPPYVLVFAMLIHEKKPSWIKVAAVGTIASVVGGLFGYIIGKFFYTFIGASLVSLYGVTEQMNTLGVLFGKHVFLAILLASLTPIPYKVFTISAGVFSAPLLPFLLASLLGRGLRFFTVAYLTHRYGVHARKMFTEQKRALYITTLILVGAVIFYGILSFYGIL